MAETISTIKGGRELYEALARKIPQKMEAKVLQRALTAGASLIVKQAKANVRGTGGSAKRKRQQAEFVGPSNNPVSRTGTLKKAIYAKRGRKSTPTQEVRIVSVRGGERGAYYGRMVEYGHRAAAPGKRLIRETTAKTKKGFDRYESKRARGSIKGISATGTVPPHPFMRPAWESTKVAAQEKIVEQIGVQIEKAVRDARWL